MRQFKFRAWNIVKKKMFSFDELELMDVEGDLSFYTLIKGDYANWIPLQWTGIKDVNGKDIYEGDILEFSSIVTYVDESDPANSGMEVGFYAQRDDFESWRLIEVGEELEVLGNIYENPELLNQ